MEAKDLGRTDVDPSMLLMDGEPQYLNSSKTTLISDPFNVRGRYPIHFHALANGATFAARQSVVVGASVWGDKVLVPGRGIAHHAGRLSIERCVVYRVRGSGMFSETGSEIGQWVYNTVMSIRGDGFPHTWGDRHEVWLSHNGHQGVAYENQGRAVLLQNNIATCCNIAFLWHHQIAPFLPVTAGVVPPNTQIFANDGQSLRLVNPIIQGGNEANTLLGSTSQLTSWRGIFGGMFGGTLNTYGCAQAQIPDFIDNQAFTVASGFRVAHRRSEDRGDITPMIARRFHVWGATVAFELINYSHLYAFYDSLWGRNSKSDSAAGAQIGTVSWEFSFGNLCLKNLHVGLNINNGNLWNYNAFPIHIKTINVDQGVAYGTIVQSGRPDQNIAYGLMGPWSAADAYPVLVRPEILYTEADFPLPYPLQGVGGGLGATDVPEMAGTPKPYFWLDPARSDTLMDNADGLYAITLAGYVVDHCGARVFGDHQSPESFPNNLGASHSPANYHIGPRDLIERNGCYTTDGGNSWSMALWFVSYERMDGSYFIFNVPITLTNFPAEFLAANQVAGAGATKPQLPLQPEATRVDDIVRAVDCVPPLIRTSDTLSFAENAPLNLFLQSNIGATVWTVGGPDGALFGLNKRRYLQLALPADGTGSFDFEMPKDADKDNVYEVLISASETLCGVSSSMTLRISVVDKLETPQQTWTDPMTRVNELTEMNPYWSQKNTAPQPGLMYTDQFGQLSGDDMYACFYTGAPLLSGASAYEVSSVSVRDGGLGSTYFGFLMSDGALLEMYSSGSSATVRYVTAASNSDVVQTGVYIGNGHRWKLHLVPATGTITLYQDSTSIGSGTLPAEGSSQISLPMLRSDPQYGSLRVLRTFTASAVP